ncbi:MAG TPA: PrsW family glutamic-type intramembrane protease [Planctomycetota bacterium]|nr:PrsW family glutamic-type intramembrane protease [Planctomycetota bacterium]HRU51240.1 PrsW family glutamic-type intramembrane protease [Planctomycetota bacterium]
MSKKNKHGIEFEPALKGILEKNKHLYDEQQDFFSHNSMDIFDDKSPYHEQNVAKKMNAEQNIFNEPYLQEDKIFDYHSYLEEMESKYSSKSIGIYVGILCISGILAVIGTFLQAFIYSDFYFIYPLIAPCIEEVFKQLGNIILLESYPFLIKDRTQIFLVAIVSGLEFAIIENLIYKNFYLSSLPATKLTAIMDFRWKYCTALHVICAFIASFSIVQTYESSLKNNQKEEIGNHLNPLYYAIGIHLAWNVLAMLSIIHVY